MHYSTFLLLAAATVGRADAAEDLPPDNDLEDEITPALQQLLALFRGFVNQPATPVAAFELEQQAMPALLELGRVCLQWAYNRSEHSRGSLPPHVEFEGTLYTRCSAKTPQEVATVCGKIRWQRFGYRPTDKSAEPTIFPACQQVGVLAGATPALAERVARYQAEAGATQRRTLQRLRQEHGVKWGVKKLRQLIDRLEPALSAERHEVQVTKVLQLLEQADASAGPHKPVLSVGRDGITFGVPVRRGTIYEVASAGTVSVYDRRGKRLGTVYLACTPESKQPTMSAQLTRLLTEVLQRWPRAVPRLCYVTDAGENETAYYRRVLRGMRHPRTRQRLRWVRVLDYYHASERLWTMAEALFGKGATAQAWARRMQKLLKKRNGVRRVLNSAAVLRGRCRLRAKSRRDKFAKAYNYLRQRTQFMRYALYERQGIPRGSGVTEAACKTIYTQRLKLSGMRWKKAGAQAILNLRVLLLSQVWAEAYQRVLNKVEPVKVPPYDLPREIKCKMAA
jgi:hypothetical protein